MPDRVDKFHRNFDERINLIDEQQLIKMHDASLFLV